MTRRNRGHDEVDRAMRRERFRVPRGPDGREIVYLAGNSLGLMPLGVDAIVHRVLGEWSGLAVDGHFYGDHPWYGSEQPLEARLAELVGAQPDEVALANTLTVNLHLLLASLHRPTGRRRGIVIEADAFPSDRYAVETHLAWHGDDPRDTLLELRPDPDSGRFEAETLIELLARRPDVATVVLGGVHYRTGDVLDMAAMTAAGRQAGCAVILDLAHAAGNVPLALHEWDVDGAVWCTYKYLNGGPGSTAAMFVHERHGRNPDLTRLGGWWGNDPDRRFAMLENVSFRPRSGASGWKMSNPTVLGFAPLGASLDVFAEVGMARLRERSVALTGHLVDLLDEAGFHTLTPRHVDRRGCQVSIQLAEPERVREELATQGVLPDVREPDVMRFAPTPLYTTFDDVERAVRALASVTR